MPFSVLVRLGCCVQPPKVRKPVGTQATANGVQTAARNLAETMPSQSAPTPALNIEHLVTLPPNVRDMFLPKHSYTAQALLEIAENQQFDSESRIALLQDLAMHLYDGNLARPIRIRICHFVASHLGDREYLRFQEVDRRKAFFENAAIDLMFTEFGSVMNMQQRTALADSLVRLLKVTDPDVETLVIQGVPRQRSALEDWVVQLQSPVAQNLGIQPDTLEISRGLDSAMVENHRGNVHNMAVVQHGNIIYKRLCDRVDPQSRIPVSTVVDELLELSTSTSCDPELIRQALVRISRDSCKNTETGLLTDLPSILSVLWSYIQQQPDPEMKRNLTQALMARLAEIAREQPCNTGCLERLLDVPSGIDHTLSIFNRQAEIRAEVAKMASVINEKFHSFFSGTELGDEARTGLIDPELIAELKKNIFEQVATQELSTIRGLNPAEIRREVERLAAGFD